MSRAGSTNGTRVLHHEPASRGNNEGFVMMETLMTGALGVIIEILARGIMLGLMMWIAWWVWQKIKRD